MSDPIETLRGESKRLHFKASNLRERGKSVMAQQEQVVADAIDTVLARLAEFEAHEKRTHERLASILGSDDALHVLAQRMKERLAEAERERDSARDMDDKLAAANKRLADETITLAHSLGAAQRQAEAAEAREKALLEAIERWVKATTAVAEHEARCPYCIQIEGRGCPWDDGWHELQSAEAGLRAALAGKGE